MDQRTFTDVMQDVLIPYINTVRTCVSGNKHTVLVVDGHISRNSLDGLTILRDPVNNIDLVILPTHTSHVAQPLELGMNHFIKLYFRQEWQNAIPDIPLEPR